MGNNPLTNPMVTPLVLPDFAAYGIVDPKRGSVIGSDTSMLGNWLRDVIKLNDSARNFRIFGPDETASNKLQAVFEVTNKQWMGEVNADDDTLAQDGRVIEMLSEHQCEGWLEGYLLTGRHGLLNSYEAFIHIITSMVNQHQK
jgi:xylulose-5-phosphate/fructose-6-phosphate phosphoketolase